MGCGIEDVARKLGWWMYYAPSMRNGLRDGHHAEDRGNAILSSLPLTDLHAVELPFGVQRRVALMATVTDSDHVPIFRALAAHLDTRASLRKGWVLGGPAARNRQARAIVEAVEAVSADGLPLVVGADINSHLGARESAVQTVSAVASRLHCSKPTHRSGFVLDHVFARLPREWSGGRCERIDCTFGSDHYPLAVEMQPEGEGFS
jgi:endonuclease/exonuclease/phosphatase family metal-dependent hydrolase